MAGFSQSRVMSLIEAATNVVVGFALAVLTQFALFPILGLVVSVSDNLLIGCVFTAVSLGRSYVLRRLFEACVCAQPEKSDLISNTRAFLRNHANIRDSRSTSRDHVQSSHLQ